MSFDSKAYQAEYYRKNRERKQAYGRDRHNANKEELNRKSREYYRRNRDKMLAEAKAYHEDHKEFRNGYARRWRQENPGKCLEYHTKRRGLTVEDDETHKTLTEMKQAATECVVCGEPFDKKHHAKSFEHIMPLNVGGKHEASNIAISGRSCNLKRPKNGDDALMWRHLIREIS